MNANSQNDQLFLNRLTAIVKTNLSDESFGVSQLANEMGMNRSQLYVRLKSITKKSASRFIREIRLNKALELLQQSDQNVSEIAYNVGFGSPAYFSNCFHEYFGFSPGEARKHIIQESVPAEDSALPTQKDKQEKPKKNWIFALAFLIILPGMYFLLFMNSSGKKATDVPEKTIMVLPFKNLSEDESTRYFADGICEDILNQLTKIADLKVTSRTSAEQFRETSLSSPVIARKMNVNYLLEGSVRRQGNHVRLSVQLIDARNDRHLWSENYDRQLEDIFFIQNDIAKNVAHQLQSIISSEELGQMGKLNTENTEAYDLYLQGKFYHRLRTKESFEKSLKYFNEALELDSNYCLAYAGLADVYVTSTFFGNYSKEEGIPKSRTCALKALSLDKNLAEAHAALGAIAIYFDYDWLTAEKELKLAMKLNPQYSRAYHLYAQFLTVIGKDEEAHIYIDKALELNPNERQLNHFKFDLYSRERNYEKAFELTEKIYYINGDKIGKYYRDFETYLRQNNISGAIEEYKNYLSIVAPKIAPEVIDSIYAEKGKTGFVCYVIDFELQRGVFLPPGIAKLYSIINEKDSALIYLEKALESGNGGPVRAVGQREFDNLRSDPRFKELLRKMNLTEEQLAPLQNN